MAWIYRRLLKDIQKLTGVPVWTDGCIITSVVSVGDTVVNVDNTDFMEYETYDEVIVVGGLIEDDWDSFEVVGLESFTTNQITIDKTFQYSWPVGSMIFPILPSRLETSHDVDIYTDYYSGVGISARETIEPTTTVTTTTVTTTTV